MKRNTKKNFPLLCQWLLRTSPETARLLDRESSGLMVIVHDTEKLAIPHMRLVVPEGILVYEAIGKYRSKAQFFFSVVDGNEMNSGYLSVVEAEKDSLNYAKNVGELLRYPWYSVRESSLVFGRLFEGKTNAPLTGTMPEKLWHPFKV